MIRRRIREFWPDIKGKTVMALGYSTPYLRYYREESHHLVAFMPAEQGALSWSKKNPNIAVLTEETQLPLPDKSIDLALVIHSLEFTSYPREMIREIWRVLKDGGRLLLVVPNRSGLWARVDKTPFGQGQTYSLPQLAQFMKENNFTPLHSEYALYIPPFRSSLLLSMVRAWEKIGHRWFQSFSGVLFLEVSKQVYAGEALEAAVWEDKLQLVKKLVFPLKN
jgi:SAM-dependent methyltransferase